MNDYPITSESGTEMLSYLPRYYEISRVIRSMLQAEGNEFDDLKQALDETLNQYFARTATWGLDIWEKELGLTPAQDQPDSERQDRIVSRLKGTGTATIRVIKEVAESFDKGAVDVVEDYSAYTIIIQFVDTTGVPPNLEDMKMAVRAVLPAHLEVIYEFNYFLWNDLDAKYWTWDELDTLGLTYDELEVYQ